MMNTIVRRYNYGLVACTFGALLFLGGGTAHSGGYVTLDAEVQVIEGKIMVQAKEVRINKEKFVTLKLVKKPEIFKVRYGNKPLILEEKSKRKPKPAIFELAIEGLNTIGTFKNKKISLLAVRESPNPMHIYVDIDGEQYRLESKEASVRLDFSGGVNGFLKDVQKQFRVTRESFPTKARGVIFAKSIDNVDKLPYKNLLFRVVKGSAYKQYLNIETEEVCWVEDLIFGVGFVPLNDTVICDNVADSPTDLTATVPTSTSVRLDWTDNSNIENRYEIWRWNPALTLLHTQHTNDGFKGAPMSFTDNTAASDQPYLYQVLVISNTAHATYLQGIPSEALVDVPTGRVAGDTFNQIIIP